MATEDAPTRFTRSRPFAIVDVLYDEGKSGFTEIEDRVGVSKSTVHRHLATLRRAPLRDEGRKTCTG